MLRKSLFLVLAIMFLWVGYGFCYAATDHAILGNREWSIDSTGNLIPNNQNTTVSNGEANTQNIGSAAYPVGTIYSASVNTTTINSALATITAMGSGTTSTMNCALGNAFIFSPISSGSLACSNPIVGQHIDLEILTSGSSPYTITFGSGFRTNGTAMIIGTNTGKIYTASFISDGTNVSQLGAFVANGTNAGM